MKLELYRDNSTNCVMGNLYADGIWKCFSLEPLEPIPVGEYPVTMEYWAKKDDYYPLLGNVVGHTGIYIHSGNFVTDTHGCILVGMRKAVDSILDSHLALTEIKSIISAALEYEEVSIIIKDAECSGVKGSGDEGKDSLTAPLKEPE